MFIFDIILWNYVEGLYFILFYGIMLNVYILYYFMDLC